jgi:hypothetical protein
MPILCQSRSTPGAMRVSVMATPRSRCGKRDSASSTTLLS